MNQNEDYQQKPSYRNVIFISVWSHFSEKAVFGTENPRTFFFTDGSPGEWKSGNKIWKVPQKTSFFRKNGHLTVDATIWPVGNPDVRVKSTLCSTVHRTFVSETSQSRAFWRLRVKIYSVEWKKSSGLSRKQGLNEKKSHFRSFTAPLADISGAEST